MAWRPEGGVERLTVTAPNVANAVSHTEAASSATTNPPSSLRPGTVAEVREIVRDAIDRSTRLRIVGRGTWLDAGRPVADATPVSLENLTGIVDYTPGDLTLTARAGTTLADIAAATAAHGQWLALAPWGGDAGSLGATAATATAGPMSGALGTPRDIIIGLEAVSGTGDVVRGGGRVVKNVAGFDLTRLMVGAWGSLGVVTEVSVRLRGLPEQDTTIAFAAPNAVSALADLLARLRSAAAAPLALEMLSATLASKLALGEQPTVLVRLVGNAEAVAAQRETIAAFGDVSETSSAIWTALRAADVHDSTTVRFSSTVSRFAETWLASERLAIAGSGHAHGSVLRSTTRVMLPHVDNTVADEALALLRASPRDVRIFERLPTALWSSLAPSAVNDRISRGVRAAFDPHRLLNPGILGED